jgi:hypothetical protein
MKRLSSREMLDLEAAGETRRDNHIVRPSLAQRRKESLLSDQLRDFVVFQLIAKRPGHTAAPRVKVYNF